MEGHPLSVTELTARIKQLLEQGFAHVEVVGEVSRLTKHASGHAYFTVKDAHAALSAVCWRSTFTRLPLAPKEGQQYVFSGYISVYEPQGRYQLIVTGLQAAGEGALAAEFERRKREFAGRGWFDPERKLKLPDLPRRIGIVTSAQAAALQDVQKVLATRPGWLEITLSPSLVQGNQAVAGIVAAIRRLEDVPEQPDVILIVRGGGSIEDLWCFNEEAVVAAMVDCEIPIITGIGHEVDTTLADLAADQRAATPSNAAELACPDRDTLRKRLPRLSLLQQLLRHVLNHQRKSSEAEQVRAEHAYRLQQDKRHLHTERAHTMLVSSLRAQLDARRRCLSDCNQRLTPFEPRTHMRRQQHLLAGMQRRLHELSYRHTSLLRQTHLAIQQHLILWPDRQIERLYHRLTHAGSRLVALDPARVLSRGYTLALTPAGRVITSTGSIRVGDHMQVRFHDGNAQTEVQSVQSRDKA